MAGTCLLPVRDQPPAAVPQLAPLTTLPRIRSDHKRPARGGHVPARIPPRTYQRRIARSRRAQALAQRHAEIGAELSGDLFRRGCLNNAAAHEGRIAGGDCAGPEPMSLTESVAVGALWRLAFELRVVCFQRAGVLGHSFHDLLGKSLCCNRGNVNLDLHIRARRAD